MTGDKRNDTEIRDLIAHEKSRGRKRGPSDVTTDRANQRLRREIQEAWEEGDEAGFVRAMREARVPEPFFSRALRKWREMRGS